MGFASNFVVAGPHRQPFARRAQLNANQIQVESNNSKVILRGSVHSWDEKDQAEQAAWGAPGVTKVENDVIVSPF